jgi:hypothetical protein
MSVCQTFNSDFVLKKIVFIKSKVTKILQFMRDFEKGLPGESSQAYLKHS